MLRLHIDGNELVSLDLATPSDVFALAKGIQTYGAADQGPKLPLQLVVFECYKFAELHDVNCVDVRRSVLFMA